MKKAKEKTETTPGLRTPKEQVRDLLATLPDDATLEDVQYGIYVVQSIERGLKAIREGDVMTQAEVEKRAAAWLEKFYGPDRPGKDSSLPQPSSRKTPRTTRPRSSNA